MNLKSKRIIQMSLTIILAACSGALMSKENESIKFSFAPGENISFIQKLLMAQSAASAESKFLSLG